MFPHRKTRRVTLKTGDYTCHGIKTEFVIERKSWRDYLHCITSARDKFQDQLSRLADYPQSVVVVEGAIPYSLSGGWAEDLVCAATVLDRTAELALASSVPIVFAGSRRAAERLGLRLLDKQVERLRL